MTEWQKTAADRVEQYRALADEECEEFLLALHDDDLAVLEEIVKEAGKVKELKALLREADTLMDDVDGLNLDEADEDWKEDHRSWRSRINVALGESTHASDCAQHNSPAMPKGPCDCGATDPTPELDPNKDLGAA